LRPAIATDRWQELATSKRHARLDAALATVSVIEAANAGEEALALAIALREAMETPHQTAALVTPDRALARRVLAALERWNIAVDDSGGDALPDTPAGIFACLAAETALGGLAPVALLALLKHPLTRLAAPEAAHARAIAALERATLRGPRPRPGSAGLASALASIGEELGRRWRGEPSKLHRSDPKSELREWELAAATRLLERVTAALAPLETLAATQQPFASCLEQRRARRAACLHWSGRGQVIRGVSGHRARCRCCELRYRCRRLC
jgi:ATP-dependent helicase/nuclease subunit B